MDNLPVIASSISDNELARAFSELVARRWDNWDLSPFLVYLVDVCDPAVLPYLAEQFDVEGLQGFGMAENEQQQRELIKKSLALHKFMGTPWAIREACRTVGFPVIILEEGITEADGISRSDDWARFRVLVHADNAKHVTTEEARKIRLFVEYYKNERSHLVELGFFQAFTEKVFRVDKEERDTFGIAIYTFLLDPNPAALTPAGSPLTVEARTNSRWSISPEVIEWNDGSGDKIYFECTGSPGDGEIKITSDYNRTADREITVEIYNGNSLLLGRLTVKQPSKWHNAYSRAYSNAYCSVPKRLKAYSSAYSSAYNTGGMYVNVSPNNVFLPEIEPAGDFHVLSNTDWEVK